MNKKHKVQYLVVDTTAFIKNAALQDIGENILTEQAVVNEITNKRQLRRLVVLPYDLKVQQAYPENIKLVTEFSKKTGDYTSLSATDLKIIALTYQLEKEKVGMIHLKDAPIPRIIKSTTDKDRKDNFESLCNINTAEKENTKKLAHKQMPIIKESSLSSSNESSNYETASEMEMSKTEELTEKFAELTCDSMNLKVGDENGDEATVDEILPPIGTTEFENEEDGATSTDDEDDDGDWITPSNFADVKKQMGLEILEEKVATVACLTTDFAMQNVLMQMGLNVAALDGRVIKQMRTFIFRCYACFKTTSIMTKVFCPNCGNKTLKRVEVTVDENGKQQIHINFRKPLSSKGKKFSLPMPKGGKHSNNPVLYEDQPMPDQRPSRLARTKNNPLDDDYLAGFSPFIVRDVYSKSAMLGIRSGDAIKYWMRRNPNESKRRRK